MPDVPAPGNPVPPDDVRALFDRIAPIYDRMNTVMTAGLDAGWRRAAVRAAELGPGMCAVDVACGSGAMTRDLARVLGPTGTVIGVDVAPAMLARARMHRQDSRAARPDYRLGDATALPLESGGADAATIAFGLRNLPDYRRALAELVRVVDSGGRVVVLEIATPRHRFGRAVAAAWFRRAVPLLGRMAGAGPAYAYLPHSVEGYPSPEAVADLMVEVGLVEVTWRRMGIGMVTLHVGRRA